MQEWKDLVADLGEGDPVSMPGSYFHNVDGTPLSMTLYGFCDASTRAYAAVVYLVLRTDAAMTIHLLFRRQDLHRFNHKLYHAWSTFKQSRTVSSQPYLS